MTATAASLAAACRRPARAPANRSLRALRDTSSRPRRGIRYSGPGCLLGDSSAVMGGTQKPEILGAPRAAQRIRLNVVDLQRMARSAAAPALGIPVGAAAPIPQPDVPPHRRRGRQCRDLDRASLQECARLRRRAGHPPACRGDLVAATLCRARLPRLCAARVPRCRSGDLVLAILGHARLARLRAGPGSHRCSACLAPVAATMSAGVVRGRAVALLPPGVLRNGDRRLTQPRLRASGAPCHGNRRRPPALQRRMPAALPLPAPSPNPNSFTA